MLEVQPYAPQTADAGRAEIEARTRAIGRDLLAGLRGGAGARVSGKASFYDRLAEWAMADEAQRWEPAPVLDGAPFGPLPRANVSLKLSSLYARFDPADAEGTAAAVKDRLRPILMAARERGVFVNVDMEQYAFKELTLQIF